MLRGRRERNNASAIINSPAGNCQSLISALMPSCSCFRPPQTGSPDNAKPKDLEERMEGTKCHSGASVFRANLYLF